MGVKESLEHDVDEKKVRAKDFFVGENDSKHSAATKRVASTSPPRSTHFKRPRERRDDSGRSSKKYRDKDTKEKSDDRGKTKSLVEEVSVKPLKSAIRVRESEDRDFRDSSIDRKDDETSGKYTGSLSDEDDESQPRRYWEGGPESNSKDESVSKEVDYEVGSRYYDKPIPDKDEVESDSRIKSDNNYVVGTRYYEKEKVLDASASKDPSDAVPRKRTRVDDPLTSRTGGAYIPPAKLRLLQASITDKTSVSYQRIAWEALKKSIHGHINKVNTSNIGVIARLLMKENIVRGRGLLCKSILQAQAASTTFTNVYACLVNVVNSKFPNIGDLLMKRVILQFKRGFKRNDKALCIASCQFIAHLVNQQIAHEILALEVLTLLLESPTDDSVEVAVAFLKEVGQKLLELSPKGTNAIFDMLRNILHQGNLEKRVQYMIEVVFQVRKDGFRSFPSIAENLDLVEEEDQYTHILTLDEAVDPEDLLNVFKHDLEYELNEDKYKALKEEIIGGSSSEGESDEDSGDESGEESSDEENENKEPNAVTIVDETETNLVALRRTIYLTIQSSLDFEECCHKLLKMDIKPGQEPELCHMLLDCCAELRTYEKFFGLLAQRFCQINRVYITPLEEMFAGSYATVHRLDTNKLRNVARFFGHLLFTDAISWQVLQSVRLNEEETTSSSRIFIKILFQELSEYMGLAMLNQRLKDPTLQIAMEGLFPRDNPKNTRFAINFFTSIGLGGLTDELREHLKTQPKPLAVAQLVDQLSSSSESGSSSESSSSSSSDSSSSSSDDEDEKNKKAKKKNIRKKKSKETEKNSNKKIKEIAKEKKSKSDSSKSVVKEQVSDKKRDNQSRRSRDREQNNKESSKQRERESDKEYRKTDPNEYRSREGKENKSDKEADKHFKERKKDRDTIKEGWDRKNGRENDNYVGVRKNDRESNRDDREGKSYRENDKNARERKKDRNDRERKNDRENDKYVGEKKKDRESSNKDDKEKNSDKFVGQRKNDKESNKSDRESNKANRESDKADRESNKADRETDKYRSKERCQNDKKKRSEDKMFSESKGKSCRRERGDRS